MSSVISSGCECARYGDTANIPMGGDGDDERFFTTVTRIFDHGGSQWWLYLSCCHVCSQHWMIAQDERIFDEFLLKRIGSTEANLIVSDRAWPSDFLRYEDVLRVLRTRCRFPIWFDLNDSPLAFTIEELRAVNPGLSLEEAADIVGVNPRDIGKLRF